MTSKPAPTGKSLLSKRRVIVLSVATALFVAANLATIVHIWPLSHSPYKTSAELAIDKQWNWGLSAVLRKNFGPVTVTNFGTFDTEGLYIPAELAAANELSLDNQSGPLTLKPSQIGELRTGTGRAAGSDYLVSKTRCLNGNDGYCPVLIFSSDKVNAKPSNFIAVILRQNEFGLVEEQLLNHVRGAAK